MDPAVVNDVSPNAADVADVEAAAAAAATAAAAVAALTGGCSIGNMPPKGVEAAAVPVAPLMREFCG